MHRILKKSGPIRTIVVAGVVAAILGSSFAVASTLVTSKNIKNGTIKPADLSKKLRTKINQNSPAAAAKPGKEGTVGPQGLTGPQGATGPSGPAGPRGDGSVRVTALDGSQGWTSSSGHEGAAEATPAPAITANGVETTFVGGGEYASIKYTGLNGKSFGEVSKAEYSAGYTQATDANGGTPYFRFFFSGPVGCGENDVVFSASTQKPDNLSVSGDYRHFDLTTGTVRYSDDPGENEATTTFTWDEAQEEFGREVICLTLVSMGAGGGYTANSTTDVGSVTLEAKGFQSTTFGFGS